MKADPPCPKCGHKMRYKKGHGTYECENPRCPILSVKGMFSADFGWKFNRIKTDSRYGGTKHG